MLPSWSQGWDLFCVFSNYWIFSAVYLPWCCLGVHSPFAFSSPQVASVYEIDIKLWLPWDGYTIMHICILIRSGLTHPPTCQILTLWDCTTGSSPYQRLSIWHVGSSKVDLLRDHQSYYSSSAVILDSWTCVHLVAVLVSCEDVSATLFLPSFRPFHGDPSSSCWFILACFLGLLLFGLRWLKCHPTLFCIRRWLCPQW